MNFDKIIVNPPYVGHLHLKILEETLNHLTEDGDIVNLSPVRWLQDPLAKYKKNSDYNKFEDTVAKHIESLEIIKAEEANKLFTADITADLGIYKITSENYSNTFFINNIIDKCVTMMLKWPNLGEFTSKKAEGNFIKIGVGATTNITKNSKNTVGCIISPSYETACKEGTINHSVYINNLSEQARLNIHKVYNSLFFRWWSLSICCGVQNTTYTPWLGDIENPRTHKIGYESDWTNEDLCNVFGITGYISDIEAIPGSEWEEILKTMENIYTN